MAGSDPWKRYLDAGMELTNLTRDRAEKIVKEFVKAGEVQREHAQQRVEDLLERSRAASAALAETVRTEVTRQLSELGLVKGAPVKKAAATAKKAAKKSTSAAKKSTSAAKKTVKKAAATAKKAAGSS